MSNFDPGPLAEVTVDRRDDRSALVFTREVGHRPDEVWSALTDPDRLREWAPYTTDRDLDGLGPATLIMVDRDTREEFATTVEIADRPSVLQYSWGDDVLRWELAPTDGGRTRLTLHHTVAGPDWVPKVAAGWQICLAVAERLLDGDPVGPIVGEDAMAHGWQDLHDAYAARLGTTTSGATEP